MPINSEEQKKQKIITEILEHTLILLTYNYLLELLRKLNFVRF